MHPTNPGAFNSRVPSTIRLRRDGYRAQLANRAIDRDWPELVQRLWYSCHNAQAVLLELEQAARMDTFHSGKLHELEQLAYTNWQAIEQYAAPIVAAVEGGR